MVDLAQDNRPIGVETPLGSNKLALSAFTGEERMSGLFQFDLQMISDEDSIDPADIVGKQVDFWVRHQDEEERYFNGFINRFVYAGRDDCAARC